MRPVLWLSAAAAAVFMSHASIAASINDVLGACDNTPGCGYSINSKNGDISGCSSQTCFYCPNDGKRECFQVGKRVTSGTPKPIAGPDNLLTNMGATEAPKKPKLGTGTGIITGAPAVSQ